MLQLINSNWKTIGLIIGWLLLIAILERWRGRIMRSTAISRRERVELYLERAARVIRLDADARQIYYEFLEEGSLELAWEVLDNAVRMAHLFSPGPLIRAATELEIIKREA